MSADDNTAAARSEAPAAPAKPDAKTDAKTVVEIAAGKLRAGEQVIVRGNENLQEGQVLELRETAADPRFSSLAARRENEEPLRAVLAEAIGTWQRDELCAALAAADVPHSPVHDYGSVVADGHVQESGTLSWLPDPVLGAMPAVNLPGTAPLEAGGPHSIAPRQGEHTDAVLAEASYSEADVAAMRAAGAVA